MLMWERNWMDVCGQENLASRLNVAVEDEYGLGNKFTSPHKSLFVANSVHFPFFLYVTVGF